LVTIDGTLLEQTGSKDQKRLLIQSGDFLFNVTGPAQSLGRIGKDLSGDTIATYGHLLDPGK